MAASEDAPVELSLAEKEAAYEKFVWDNLKRNYIGNYLHGMLGMTGFRLINAPTFLPAYLHMISGSNTIVGLGLALQQVGSVISPIFGATQIEHRSKVMPAAVWMGGLARVQIVGMALAGWFLKDQSLVVTMMILMFLFGLFMGTQRVVFGLLMAKVIPLSRRGRLQAWRNATGGLIAAALAWAAGKYLIEGNVFGNGYATTFALAAFLTSLGLWALQLLLREPEPPNLPAQARFRDRVKDFPALIMSDKGYAWFLVVQMVATASRIATPFYIIFVSSTMKLDGMTLGLLSLAFLGADTLSNLVWGYLGDKTGFKLVLTVSLFAWAMATTLLMLNHAPWAVFLAFFGLGAAQSGYMMAAQTMILEFGSRAEMPMRIAISSTAEGIMASLGPLAGGFIADHYGFNVVFGASIGFLVLGLLILLTVVKEPRTARMASL
ncbi:MULTISPECIES: MFS transporter [unclassified Phenylobacterium]|uniref:MFS transporter n=1 Tax=unclassified Phenylobacterium TaxID=2640670 RepID=UPI0022B4B3AC|nr:MFS transporter [Phenylobacterium sp. NIBR 498073]WGU39372.1 MFS transporter [Phenylobacterium sp. NIBR 498073]